MFFATIVICAAGSLTDCSISYDTRGPYQTEDECFARIIEMEPLLTEQFFLIYPEAPEANIEGLCGPTDPTQSVEIAVASP